MGNEAKTPFHNIESVARNEFNGVSEMESATFDCVDIYKQPAFDHPLLNDHKIQMEPTFPPLQTQKHAKAVLEEMNCPNGTVPIRRTEKEDLIRAKYFSETYAPSIHHNTVLYPGLHVAVMKPDENKTYYGAHATINVQALDVKDDQYSTAQIWVGGGPKDQQVSLEAGWMVSPQVAKDKLTRVYIYWTAPNSKTGCYNFLCPGFVQVSSKAAPGSHILGTSVYGGTQFVINLIISQDKATGNWWVIVQGIHLGYWPKSLIPQLEGGASIVAWGGVAAGPPNGESPPMGNGHYPQDDDYTKACFMQNLQTIDASNRYVVPDENKIPTYLDNRECYGLLYSGYRKERGISFLFGGPGGKCGV